MMPLVLGHCGPRGQNQAEKCNRNSLLHNVSGLQASVEIADPHGRRGTASADLGRKLEPEDAGTSRGTWNGGEEAGIGQLATQPGLWHRGISSNGRNLETVRRPRHRKRDLNDPRVIAAAVVTRPRWIRRRVARRAFARIVAGRRGTGDLRLRYDASDTRRVACGQAKAAQLRSSDQSERGRHDGPAPVTHRPHRNPARHRKTCP